MNTTKTETVTCEICGKSLDRNLAKHAPVVGYVGSTCYTKIAAMQEVLEHNALGFLANGPIRVTREMMDSKEVVIPANFERRAYLLGLAVQVEIERDENDEMVAVIFTPSVRSGKKLRKSLRA